MKVSMTPEERNEVAQAIQRLVDFALHATSSSKVAIDADKVDRFAKILKTATMIEISSS